MSTANSSGSKLKKKALVFGATGLVGKQLIQQLVAKEEIERIHIVNRREQSYSSNKIKQHVLDYSSLEEKNEMTLKNKEQIAKQFEPEIQKLNNGITALKDEISDKEKEVNELYETYIAEAEGRKGTLLLGKGPVYQEKRDKHDAALLELSQLKQDNGQKVLNNEAAIAQLQADWKKAELDTQPIISNFDGFMARINALGKLPWLPSFFIFLLFLAIETAPIFAKLVSPRGEYDFKLEDEETGIKTWVEQQVHQRDVLLDADVVVNGKVYTDIQEDEDVYAYKRKVAKQMMQDQADAFYEKQKRLL